MTRKQSLVVVIFAAIVAAVASVIIYSNAHDDEMNVYVALIDKYNKFPAMRSVALLSVVSTCGVEDALLSDANGESALPRSLERLSGIANVVSWKDTRLLHETGVRSPPPGNSKAWEYVRISRVGFNAARDKAALCIQSSYTGHLIYLEKSDGAWSVSSDQEIWVS